MFDSMLKIFAAILIIFLIFFFAMSLSLMTSLKVSVGLIALCYLAEYLNGFYDFLK